MEGMEQSDYILLLEIPLVVRRKRIVTRWIKQRLGLEKCIYRPHLAMLRAMFRWAKNYDTGEDGTKGRVLRFKEKTIVLHNQREIEELLHNMNPDTKNTSY